MQVQGKRRRRGYHQEDVKHAGAGKEKKGEDTMQERRGRYVKHAIAGKEKEKKGRIPPRRC